MRHKWQDEDDRTLREAVVTCEPLREFFATTRGHAGWWAAVVGRCGLAVSPDAARSRWERLCADDVAAEAAAAAAVPPVDPIIARLDRLETSVAAVHALLRELARAWGIAC